MKITLDIWKLFLYAAPMQRKKFLHKYGRDFIVKMAAAAYQNGALNVRKRPLYVPDTKSAVYQDRCTIDVHGNIEGIKPLKGVHGSYKFSLGKSRGYVSYTVADLLVLNFPYLCPPPPDVPEETHAYPFLLPNRHHCFYIQWRVLGHDEMLHDRLPVIGWDTPGIYGHWEFRGTECSKKYKAGEIYAFASHGGKGMNIHKYARHIIEITHILMLPLDWRGMQGGVGDEQICVVPDHEYIWVPFGSGNHEMRTHDGVVLVKESAAVKYFPEVYKI